jgi:outer membrane lipoprotein-sorting protein
MKTVGKIALILCFFVCGFEGKSQTIDMLVGTVREKLDKVVDYEAVGKMKTNVSFLKIPVSQITIFYKKPNKLKLKSTKGFSFLPKGAVNINVNQMLQDKNYTIIDAGKETINAVVTRVAKLIPLNEESDVVISTLYIDPVNAVVLKSKTTTKENGTFELNMTYGKYISMALPDKINFSFHTKDYKLPKGITFDFDDGSKNKAPKKNPSKGMAEISISNYIINKGIPDQFFK